MLIDPFRFAKKGDQLEKVFNLKPEGRLEGLITANSDVNLHLEGNMTEQKKFVLDGRITGKVSVQCQVCLDNIQMPIDFDFKLYPVSSEQLAEDMQQEFEPVIVEDNKLALDELVINELILSMPVVSTHIDNEGKDCTDKVSFTSGSLPEVKQDEKKVSPFAILNSIKQKD